MVLVGRAFDLATPSTFSASAPSSTQIIDPPSTVANPISAISSNATSATFNEVVNARARFWWRSAFAILLLDEQAESIPVASAHSGFK